MNKEPSKCVTNNIVEQSKCLNELVKLCHDTAKNSGWWTDPETGEYPIYRNKGELIALMHSELSEAIEAIRTDSFDKSIPHRKGEDVELADTLIRIFDYCGAYKINIGTVLAEKLEYNKTREDHKLENRVKDGGKRF